MSRALFVFVGIAVLPSSGCGGDELPTFEPADGACGTVPPPQAPAPIADDCIEAATSCPPEPPQPGAACAGNLSCPYDEDYTTWSCSSGRWQPYTDDAPPFGEMCLDPFEGQRDGGRVVLGPVATGPLQPFGDCDRVDLEYGPQGGAMLPFRLQIDGVEAPECVLVETRLTVGERSFDASGSRVALHCGQSLLIYSVVPWELQSYLCHAPDEVVFTIEADVQGIGTGRARVLVPSPGTCEEEPQYG